MQEEASLTLIVDNHQYEEIYHPYHFDLHKASISFWCKKKQIRNDSYLTVIIHYSRPVDPTRSTLIKGQPKMVIPLKYWPKMIDPQKCTIYRKIWNMNYTFLWVDIFLSGNFFLGLNFWVNISNFYLDPG